jgi:hypothetical protein
LTMDRLPPDQGGRVAVIYSVIPSEAAQRAA